MSGKTTLPVMVYDALLAAHGPQQCFLVHNSALQLLVATILSAQCTDKTVNLVTADLFLKYPDAAAFANAVPEELEQAIRRCGYYRAKAAHIMGACSRICSDFHGEVPDNMDALTTLPGVGRKTANVVLGDFFQVPGFPVDTHVIRLSNRIGLCRTKDPVKIEQQLCSRIIPENWAQFSHLLIIHGRVRCMARKPDCANCEIASYCKKRGVK
jgi:endonuclease-3